MHLPAIATLLLLPFLAVAQDSSTTTLTSTATLTKTITISQVVASVTSTLPAKNSTATYAPTTSSSVVLSTASSASSTSIPSNVMNAAPNLKSVYAGSAGVLAMIAAALM